MSKKIKWTADAEAKLKEIPFFVRSFAKKRIENYAQENSIEVIDMMVYEQSKKLFHKKLDN